MIVHYYKQNIQQKLHCINLIQQNHPHLMQTQLPLALPPEPQIITICPSDKNSSSANHHRWCTFQSADPSLITIQLIYLALLVIMGVIIVYCLYKLCKYRAIARYREYFGNTYLLIYVVVTSWYVLSLTRVILCVCVYFHYMYHDFNLEKIPDIADPPLDSPIVILTIFYNILNSACAFLINLAMLIIPYLWIRNALDIVQEIDIADGCKIKFKTWYYFIAFIRLYYKYIRNLFPIMLLLEPLAFYFLQDIRCKLPYINLYFIIVQATLFLFLYMAAGYMAHTLTKSKLISLQKQSIELKSQFVLMFLVLLARLTRNMLSITSIIPSDLMYWPNGNCSNMNQNNIYLVCILIIHHFIMHLIPICTILWIYQPNLKKLKKYQDLLDIDGEEDGRQNNYNAIARGFYKGSIVTKKSSDKSNISVEYSHT